MILNQTTKKIIKQAVDYEIENNEQLYQKLQDLRKCGGATAMKAYWREFHLRADAYEHVIKSEIKTHIMKAIRDKLTYLVHILLIINLAVIFLFLIILDRLSA